MPEILTNNTTVHDACAKLAFLYKDVAVADSPLSRWLHLVNDATVLAEEIRRGREQPAILRLAIILCRVLEFTGHYLQVSDILPVVHRDPNEPENWHLNDSVLLSMCLGHQSARDLPYAPAAESLTKWVITKYPHTCGKCGASPCECVLTPWIFEERRQNPGPYRKYSERVTKKRQDNRDWNELTLAQLFGFFAGIFRNSFHYQDSWKIVMHLTEEIGEATVELNRLSLICATPVPYVADEKDRVFERAAARLRQESELITQSTQEQASHLETWTRRLDFMKQTMRDLSSEASATSWIHEHWPGLDIAGCARVDDLALRLFFAELISEKFKEELSDVVSWVAALGCKLSKDDHGLAVIQDMARHYSEEVEGVRQMVCSWCKRNPCSNGCLIRHSLRDELVQSVMKM